MNYEKILASKDMTAVVINPNDDGKVVFIDIKNFFKLYFVPCNSFIHSPYTIKTGQLINVTVEKDNKFNFELDKRSGITWEERSGNILNYGLAITQTFKKEPQNYKYLRACEDGICHLNTAWENITKEVEIKDDDVLIDLVQEQLKARKITRRVVMDFGLSEAYVPNRFGVDLKRNASTILGAMLKQEIILTKSLENGSSFIKPSKQKQLIL